MGSVLKMASGDRSEGEEGVGSGEKRFSSLVVSNSSWLSFAKVYPNQQTNQISSVFICVHLWFQILNSDFCKRSNNRIRNCLLIILAGFLTSSCGIQFSSPPQILTGGLNSQRADESPAYSSDGRYLAFASDRNRSRDIFLYDLQQRRLIDLPNLNRRDSSQDQPALSADGRFLAYVSSERGKTDILVYDRQTQRSQLLTGGVRGSVRHPTISGDGRYVAYETSQLGQWHIAIVERGVN